ncbi:MAG: tetratricopeptide repeat protein [Pseudomonadota bacterium]|jgi:predicted negative regulator of RcsB-dependent stress response
MAYDFEEQEQIDALKAWWKRNGTATLVGVAVFVAIVAGAQGWRHYQKSQTLQAAELYDLLQGAAEARNLKKTGELAGQLLDKYAGTPYAARAALVAAKASYEGGDAKNAKTRLQWVMDHANTEEMRDSARLRLAGILLDEKNYTEALKLLDVKPGEAFAGLYADLRGDVLLASGKAAEARAAYQAALGKLGPGSAWRGQVEMKLEALGGGA